MKCSILVFTLFVLFSCTENQSKKEKIQTDIQAIDTTKCTAVSIKDSKLQIKKKLQICARLDNAEFGELIVYDEFFKDKVTKFFVKQINSEQRYLTAIINNDHIRYIKVHLKHVENSSLDIMTKHILRLNDGLDNAIKNGTYSVLDKHYLKLVENGEVWLNVWIVTGNTKIGYQDYWNLMSPETDYDYLKFMAKSFLDLDKSNNKFVVNR